MIERRKEGVRTHLQRESVAWCLASPIVVKYEEIMIMLVVRSPLSSRSDLNSPASRCPHTSPQASATWEPPLSPHYTLSARSEMFTIPKHAHRECEVVRRKRNLLKGPQFSPSRVSELNSRDPKETCSIALCNVSAAPRKWRNGRQDRAILTAAAAAVPACST